MYQQNILDHYKHPRNFGDLPNTKNKAHAANPLCGDELDYFLEFDQDDKITAVKFNGRGCAVTIAAASMLSEKLQNMDRSAISRLSNEDMIKLLGVEINPARLKCATLGLEAAQKAAK